MKKFVAFIMAFLTIVTFTSCAISFERETITASVVSCEKGAFIPDYGMMNMANIYRSQKNVALANSYMALARTNGSYNYNITVSVDGDTATVTRNDAYEAGETIDVTKITFENGKVKYE